MTTFTTTSLFERATVAVTIVALFLMSAMMTANAASITPEPGAIRANFGVDGDLYRAMSQFTVINPGAVAGSDDWFLPAGTPPIYSGMASPTGVIDTTGMARHRALSLPGDGAANRTFVAHQAGGINNIVSGKLWLDAIYVRDSHSSQNANDSTVFDGTSNKNADNTRTWKFKVGSVPQKNDLIDAAAHLRRDGLTDADSLWLFAITTTLSSDGNAHNDYEFFRTIPQYTSDGIFLTGGGPDSGHTAWKIVGGQLKRGDILITMDYENGGSTPVPSIRIWARSSDTSAIQIASGGAIRFTGVATTGGTAAGPFGYFEIRVPDGTFFSRVNKTDANDNTGTPTLAAPFGHLTNSQATFDNTIQGLALAEVGLNLTALGLDIQAEGDCDNLFGAIVFKTRSSSSFTASLKDIAGPFPFGQVGRRPVILTTGGTLTCSSTSLQIMANAVPSDNVLWSWNGPGGFTSLQQNPTVTASGTYTVTATRNGCSSTSTVSVNQNTTPPGASATGGSLTCTITSVELQGSAGGVLTPGIGTAEIAARALADVDGFGFLWNGPGGFTSTEQNPIASASGTYTLTVTNSDNGCTSTATAAVTQNTTPPGATAVGGSLTCTTTSVALSGSTTSGTSFLWNGPGGFTSTQQNPTVSVSGTYSLTTTNSVNGCTSTATALVEQTLTPPGATASGGELTCAATSVSLTGSTSTGTNFFWNGPSGFTSAAQNPSVSVTGGYTLTVTNSLNGCTSQATTSVSQNTTPPGASATGGSLSCATTSTTLSGATSTGTSFLWNGPGGFTSTQQNPSVSVSGGYTLTTTNSANGCTSTASANVTQMSVPPGASATGGTLTCTTTSVQLQGAPAGFSYLWNGPGGFTSTQQNPAVTTSGTYTLLVTNNANGCTSTTQTTVDQNTTAPGASATGGTISCTVTSVTLNALPVGMTYLWNGPGGFTSTQQNPSVSVSGGYTLRVTDGANGCTSTALANVDQNTIPPGASATGGTITCTTTSTQLLGATTSGTSFLWNGPGGFSSTQQNPTVSVGGTYTLITTNSANGCTSMATALVDPNTTPPGASATGGELTCASPTVQLLALPNGFAYSWSRVEGGFSSSLQNPTIAVSGTYIVRVTNTANGCTSTASALVTQNSTPPGASATGGTLTCTTTSVQLVGAPGGFQYLWNGPGGFSSTQQNPIVIVSGTYSLRVTNSANGCTSATTTSVDQSISSPGATAGGGTLTCTTTSVTLSAAPAGMSYLWNGPSGFTSSQQNPTVTVSGTYSLRVTNSANGCTSTASTLVDQNTALPGATASGGNLTCTTTSVQLTGSTTTGNQFLWNGPGGFTSTQQNPTVSVSGAYTFRTTNSSNGCTSSTSTNVTQNTTPPGASATGGIITCTSSCVTITGGTTFGTSFSWSGPGGFTSTQQSPTVCVTGCYTLIVTNSANGCTSSAQVCITGDTNPPGASATGGDITCTTTSVTLNGLPAGFQYLWNGPGGFSSTQQNPTVAVSGTYTLRVTNSVNGCTSVATADVTQNTTAPTCALTAPVPPPHCGSTGNVLQAATSADEFFWSVTGTGWVITGGQNTNQITYTAGNGDATFKLVVTNTLSGCTDSCTVTFPCSPGDTLCTLTQGAYGNAGGKFKGVPRLTMMTQLLATDLVIGKLGTRSVTFPGGSDAGSSAQCIINKLPAGGPADVLPSTLGDKTISFTTCNTSSPALPEKNSRFKNVFLGQLITLSMNVRLSAPLGDTPVCAEMETGRGVYHISGNVLNALNTLGLPLTVNGVLELANRTIAGMNTGINASQASGACGAINEMFDDCSPLIYCGVNRGINPMNPNDAMGEQEVPKEFALHQNYPNPFNPQTRIEYDLPEVSHVRLSIFNMLGQEVATLVNGEVEAGYQNIYWSATNNVGQTLPTGIYIYRLQVTGASGKEFVSVKKMLLMK